MNEQRLAAEVESCQQLARADSGLAEPSQERSRGRAGCGFRSALKMCASNSDGSLPADGSRTSKAMQRKKSFTTRAADFGHAVMDHAHVGKPRQTHLAAGHLRAHDIVHVNTNVFWLDLGHRIMFGPPLLVLLFALLIYVLCIVLFACVFFAFGASCYSLGAGNFSFYAMLWISTHTFSTVGFGNVAPAQTCVAAQLVVLVESFTSLLVVSTIGGYVVKMFLRPLSRVRFSTNILMNNGRRRVAVDDEHEHESQSLQSFNAQSSAQAAQAAQPNERTSERKQSFTEPSILEPKKYKFLTFRMVRQGRVQLRDVRVAMQAQYWISGSTAFGDRDSHKGRGVNLKLEQNYFTALEQLQVWHKLDESSPLFRMRHRLHQHLDGVEVSVTAVDMGSLQQVMFYKRYEKGDFIRDAVFDNTLSESLRARRRAGGNGGTMLEADHSKLDAFSAEDPANAPKKSARNRKRSVTDCIAAVSAAASALPCKSLRENSRGRNRPNGLQPEASSGVERELSAPRRMSPAVV